MQQQRCGNLIRNLQKFRLVTFDVTDTLLRFRYPVSHQYKMIAEQQFGITGIDEKQLDAVFRRQFKSLATLHPNFGATTRMPWQQWWQQLVEHVFASIKPDLSLKKRGELASALVLKYRTRDCWCVNAGGRPLIERIRASGKQVGVISNFDASLGIVLREMEMDKLFDFVLNSYEAGVQKPHSGIFDHAVDICKIHPNEALHIGNHYDLDYVGARNAGWASILITNSTTPRAKTLSSPLAYGNLNELLVALETEDIKW